MEEMLKTLPQHTCTWLQGKLTMYKYQHFWAIPHLLEGVILAQQTFKANPTDVFLCSAPKTGTTWLKSLAFAITTREQFNESTTPLLTKIVHECVPFLERHGKEIEDNRNENSSTLQLVATHLPYTALPESVITLYCKIVYIYRNTKDVIVSYYHYFREALKMSMDDAPFEEAFEEFCQGIFPNGPYRDHIMGYWKASLERPERILLLKYEDLKKEPSINVKRLAEFTGCPFSVEEEKAGVVDNIINFCSFQKLSGLEVNKTGKRTSGSVENRLYFRKAKDGDWENYLSDEMIKKIDKLMDEKLGCTGLVLK